MRTMSCFLVAALLSIVPASASEVVTGKFRCTYSGGWACGSGPEGICIDSGGRRGERAVLELDFERNRLRLNGLDGSLERQNLKIGHYVYWRLDALGLQEMRVFKTDRGHVAELENQHLPSSGTAKSEFACRPVR